MSVSVSPVEQTILDTLRAVVPEGYADMILGEALRNAGALAVPSGGKALRDFVSGPLRVAAAMVAGDERGALAVRAVSRRLRAAGTQLGVPIPTSEPGTTSPPRPSPRADPLRRSRGESTLDYEDFGTVKRHLDVVIFDPDRARGERLRDHVEQLGIRAFAVIDPSLAPTIATGMEASAVVAPWGDLTDEQLAALRGARRVPVLVHEHDRIGVRIPPEGVELIRYGTLEELARRLRSKVGGDAPVETP